MNRLKATSCLLGIVLLLVSGCAPRTGEPEQHAGESSAEWRSKFDLPASWFLRQRVGEQGVLPVDARAHALAALNSDVTLRSSTGSWLQAGPVNIGGRISALARDPNDVNRIWMGAAGGGVFVSTDGGDSWTPVFDDQTALSVGSIATHPTDSTIVYVGTGEEAGGGYSYDGEGLFKTTDGGITWVNIGLGEVRRIGRVAVDPAAPQRIFVAAMGGLYHRDTNRGLYRSTDGGNNWQNVLFIADDAGIVDVAIDPNNSDRVFAASWERFRGNNESHFGGANSGIWRSLDGGDTWTRLTAGLPTGSVGRIGLAVAPSLANRVYAIIGETDGGLDGIYRSDDGGDDWSRVSKRQLGSSFSRFTYYFGQIRVDPSDPSMVYALDIDLWRSLDGGINFATIGQTLHADQHALLTEANGLLYVGNDGGFYRSADGGSSFSHNVVLPISQFYDLCVDPQLSDRRFGGTQDNGTMRTTTGRTDDWAIVLGGDGMHCEVDPTDSNRVYAELQWGAIYRSTDGGSSFVSATNGIDFRDRNNWVTPITLDPSNPTTLYTGTQRAYRSTDAAVSWTAVSQDLSNGPGSGPNVSDNPEWRETYDHGQSPIQGTVTAIAVSPRNSNIIWAGTDDGNVWVSDDFGSVWNLVTPPGPVYWVTEIHADPDDDSRAYMTVTGYRSDDTLPYIRMTEDLGATWTDLSSGTGLPQLPLNSVVRDPAWKGRLFVASDIGVHVSEDDGGTWSLLGSEMPPVVVQDLVLHELDRVLFAATHARSVYSYDLSQLPAADGDGDGVDNNSDCALADAGAFAIPLEVATLNVNTGPGNGAELFWTSLSGSSGPGTVYDIARGDVSVLSTDGVTAGAETLACGVGTNAIGDSDLPTPNAGFYYLVRGKNVCGVGTGGQDSLGGERGFPNCP
jgi:photosystem II stability/assembly factor-like uncharacterized protein